MTELVLPDPCVVLLIGAAGAGKSTFAARHFPADAILSSDALREVIAGDAADQRVNGPAFAALHRALDRRLRAGRPAIVDATNLTTGSRAAIQRIAARHRVPVVAIVLDLPEAVVRRQNASRPGRRVPDDVVERHLAALAGILERGRLEVEGYARVVRLTDSAAVDRLEIRMRPPAGPAPTPAPGAPDS